jgi:hypothetical protein
MKIGIIVKLKLSKKEDIVDEPDEHAETPRAQTGNDTDRKGEEAQERKVPGVFQGLCHGVHRATRSRLPPDPALARPISQGRRAASFS